MKILILANNQKWKSWDDKIKELTGWFRPAVDLEFTLEHTKLSNIPLEEYTNIKGEKSKGINKAWYDENISIPSKAKGYDIVIFSVNKDVWRGYPSNGWHTGSSHGIHEIQLTCKEEQEYTYHGNKYEGSRWFNLARHELCHAIYDIRGIPDRTHYHWDSGDLSGVLLDLTAQTPMPPTYTYRYFNPTSDPKMIGLRHELMVKIDAIRHDCGFPITINDGLRTKKENDALKDSASNSGHLRGWEADIACTDSSKRDKIIELSYKHGITRRGIGKRFVHLGIDPSLAQNVMWHYY